MLATVLITYENSREEHVWQLQKFESIEIRY